MLQYAIWKSKSFVRQHDWPVTSTCQNHPGISTDLPKAGIVPTGDRQGAPCRPTATCSWRLLFPRFGPSCFGESAVAEGIWGPLLLNGCRICRVYATTHQKQKKSVLPCQRIPSLPVCSRDCPSSELRGISAFPSFWRKHCSSSMPTSYGTLAASDWQVQSHLSPSDPKPASFSLRFTKSYEPLP